MGNQNTSFHSVCRWTFHAGKGGFQPANVRPTWAGDKFSSVDFVKLVAEKIAPRLPQHIKLGVELHYDTEIDDKTAPDIAAAIKGCGLHLAMITPGAHSHFGYGGVASLDRSELEAARTLGNKTVELTYGVLKDTWHPDPAMAPSFVLWNGSYGYDLATIAIREMYKNLKESVTQLCLYESKLGGKLFFGIEPKPNEGHPCMLLPTVASALLLWKKIAQETGMDISKKGLNMEFGHSEMIGLDHVYDIVEQIDNDAVMHIHLNSQGYNDGLIYGGPGKYDIDHGVRINGMNIAIAGLLADGNYKRWRGHDMQARPYDNEAQAIDRVIRSIISWEACEHAARNLNTTQLLKLLANKETGKAEDMMRESVVDACAYFKEVYQTCC
jgi:xylose isomerase